MLKKLLFLSFLVIFVSSVISFIGVQNANAQFQPSFPPGCTSALGYSVTNGIPCNGTSVATLNVPGCTTALGYSITTGIPCSGSSVAIQYLAGCYSIYGYSTIYSVPCNGTSVASSPTSTEPTTPGLPTTGAGGNAFSSLMILISSGVVALGGSIYLFKRYNLAK